MAATPPIPRGPLVIAPAVTPYTPPLYASEINERALIIDTVTTGRSVTSEVIEIAVCDVESRILYESLVRPTASVPKAAARIHGLLTTAPTWDAVWQISKAMGHCYAPHRSNYLNV